MGGQRLAFVLDEKDARDENYEERCKRWSDVSDENYEKKMDND